MILSQLSLKCSAPNFVKIDNPILVFCFSCRVRQRIKKMAAAARSYDKRRYQTIYPQYIDANLLPRDGRRLSVAQAVANPSLEEILGALLQLGFKDCFVDPTKSLPPAQAQARMVPAPRGCVKVAIKAPVDQHYIKKSEFDVQTRAVIVEDSPNRSTVMRQVAALIKERTPVRPPVPSLEGLILAAMGASSTGKAAVAAAASSRKK